MGRNEKENTTNIGECINSKIFKWGSGLRLSPSLLATDFSNLRAELKKIEEDADFLHIDVMDGHFVPNLSFGLPIIESIRRHTDLYFDCHLMVNNPQEYVQSYAKAGVNHFSFHIEVEKHAHRLIESIHQSGMTAGVVLNPASSLSLVEEVLPDVELVLLMSVNPGFGGQKCIMSTIDKVRRLASIRKERKLNFDIQVDGGINLDNFQLFLEAGANNLVAGSSVFKSSSPSNTLKKMKEAII